MLNPRIKLRHLQAFLEVAKHNSFARAAERLYVSQPAMSKTIRELEDEVATRLFERGSKGVTLTPSGLTLLRHAGPALKTLNEGLTALQHAGDGAALVKLGALSTVEGGVLPTAIAQLHAEYPEVRLQVKTGSSAYLLSQLGLGELDLVMGRMSEAHEIRGLTYEHLCYEPMVLVARPQHPLAGRDTIPWSAASRCPWVVPPAPTTLREQLERYWVEQGSVPPIALETLSLPLSRRYVLASDAVWVAPLDAVSEAIDDGRLWQLPVELEIQGGSVGVCVNATQGLSFAARRLRDQMRILLRDT